MRCHANARLSPKGRELLVDRIESKSQTVRDAAQSAGISERTARKWVARYRAEGVVGLEDRSSAPSHVANRTAPETVGC
jgi:transposase